MCRPRAATFVATSEVTCPFLNWARVRVRCGWDFPLCRAAAATPLARRCRVSWSTPCLVSRNSRTRPSRAAISVVTAYRSGPCTTKTWCSIADTALEEGSTEWTAGSRR